MEMLSSAMETLDSHVDRLDTAPSNRKELVELAGRVRKALEGMWNMLELYNWVDDPQDSTYGATPLTRP